MNFRIESILTLIAITISLVFIWFPHPYVMAVFLFIAIPLFIYVVGYTLIRVFRELREKDVF